MPMYRVSRNDLTAMLKQQTWTIAVELYTHLRLGFVRRAALVVGQRCMQFDSLIMNARSIMNVCVGSTYYSFVIP